MGKYHIRPKEEKVLECSNCASVWKLSWLEPHQHEDECPFCYTNWKVSDEPVVYEVVKNRPNSKLQVFIKNRINMEAGLETALLEKIKHEATGVVETKASQGYDEAVAEILARHGHDLYQLSIAENKIMKLMMHIAQIDHNISKCTSRNCSRLYNECLKCPIGYASN